MQDIWIRYRVKDWAGNLRYWPGSINKANQDKNLDAKFILGQETVPVSEDLNQFGLSSIGDVRRASLVDEESLQDWEIAAKSGKNVWDWKDAERFAAFRRAAENRRYHMYQSLYQALSWDEWEF